jgi:hypothetical protein
VLPSFRERRHKRKKREQKEKTKEERGDEATEFVTLRVMVQVTPEEGREGNLSVTSCQLPVAHSCQAQICPPLLVTAASSKDQIHYLPALNIGHYSTRSL